MPLPHHTSIQVQGRAVFWQQLGGGGPALRPYGESNGTVR